MPFKRVPTEDEIAALAEQFRATWKVGGVVRPWLRQHNETLLDLVHGDWSWDAVGRAMTKAGITYRTGKPWTADWLQSECYRARAPLKGYVRRRAADVSRSPNNPERHNHREDIRAWTPELPAVADEPEFKPASFIDWDAERHNRTDANQADRVESAGPGKSGRYEEVIAHLTGKKPPE